MAERPWSKSVCTFGRMRSPRRVITMVTVSTRAPAAGSNAWRRLRPSRSISATLRQELVNELPTTVSESSREYNRITEWKWWWFAHIQFTFTGEVLSRFNVCLPRIVTQTYAEVINERGRDQPSKMQSFHYLSECKSMFEFVPRACNAHKLSLHRWVGVI